MTPQSHAQQLLDSLYRKVLHRRRSAHMRPRIEPLPRRVLLNGCSLYLSDASVVVRPPQGAPRPLALPALTTSTPAAPRR